MTKPEEYCHHPKLFPTQWEQKRPEPALMTGCECGQNVSCPVCGWGRAAYPCKCTRPDPGVTYTVNYIANYTKEQAT